MRAPVAVMTALATAVGVVVAGAGGGGASAADLLPAPTLSPLPTVSVPLPTESVPLPETSLTDPVDDTVEDVTGGGDGDGGGAGDSGSTAGGTTSSTTGSSDGGAAATGGDRRGSDSAEQRRERREREARPMVAGTAAARDLVDDEHSPELRAAGRAFLTADRAIAEIAHQRQVMDRLEEQAAETAQYFRALGYDVLAAQATADTVGDRYESVRGQMTTDARTAYVNGQPTTDDGSGADLVPLVASLNDRVARASLRVGDLTLLRDAARAEFETIAARHAAAKTRVEQADRALAALTAQRSNALAAVQAAKAGDLALHRARLAESGELGTQIRAASAALQRSGRTVDGTGTFAQPSAGGVTSPYGMRYHPILKYPKLHTGTDFAGGSSAVRAADDGRVLMTVVSAAYGNFTVVDHGVLDGRRVTTAYAHQAQFLVREGQAVRKGEQIGVIGSTGYSTGPHLHFEVREDGAVVNPVTWLSRG